MYLLPSNSYLERIFCWCFVLFCLLVTEVITENVFRASVQPPAFQSIRTGIIKLFFCLFACLAWLMPWPMPCSGTRRACRWQVYIAFCGKALARTTVLCGMWALQSYKHWRCLWRLHKHSWYCLVAFG